MSDLPIPISNLEGEDLIQASELMQYFGLSRSSFYSRLRELDINPRRIGKGSYLTQQQTQELVDLHKYLHEGGTIAAFKERRAVGAIVPAQTEQIIPSEPEESVEWEFGAFETLQKASDHKWLLPTSALAQLLHVAPSTVTGQGEKFKAFGFTFTRTNERWKNSIQWKVSQS